MLWGSDREFEFIYKTRANKQRRTVIPFEGVMNNIDRRYHHTNSNFTRRTMREYMTELPCPKCHGKRLNQEALCVRCLARILQEVSDLSVKEAIHYYENLELSENEAKIAAPILSEILSRLTFLRNVGLDYLCSITKSRDIIWWRSTADSFGNSNWFQFVWHIMYILDEPSIGLHQRDNTRLINSLKAMRDLGNTLIVVEHDEETMLGSII